MVTFLPMVDKFRSVMPLVPMLPIMQKMRAFGVVNIGNSENIFTNARQMPFKVLSTVPLVSNVIGTNGTNVTNILQQKIKQNTSWVNLPTRERSRNSIW